MDEKKRTKILAGTLAVVLLFMWLRPHETLLAPIDEAAQRLDDAQNRHDRESAKYLQLGAARVRIERAENTSLPPRASDAQRLYQSWITNLAEQCRFSRPDVQPGNKTPVRGQFATVEVNVDAETDLEGLSRFLYLFEQADLMHRISSLEINSTGATGKPRLEVTLTAEGLSMVTSKQRADIFARSSLTEAIEADTEELTIAEAADFPRKTPFLAQIGREMIQVTSAEGRKWKVERGILGTSPADHTANEVVQQFPISPLRRDVEFADYETLLAASPFTKPAPAKVYSPRLASISDRTIVPGEKVEMTARAEDMDPELGEPEFLLVDAADGMSIDPQTGKFLWETPEDIEPKAYTTTVLLKQANNEELKLEKEITITVRRPNDAPTIEAPESATVVLGQEFKLEVNAQDDDGEDGLTFSLDGDVPEGLAIEDQTLTWTPPKTFKPGEYTVAVKVTDSGSPAKSATHPVRLMVKDDDALMTMFTGSVALNGVPVAWFRNIAKNVRPELKLGDRVVVAEIDAELTEIAPRHILLADAGGVWRVNLGDNLRQRILVKAAAKPEPDSDAAAENDDAAGPDTDYDNDPPKEKSPDTPTAEGDTTEVVTDKADADDAGTDKADTDKADTDKADTDKADADKADTDKADTEEAASDKAENESPAVDSE